MEKSGECSNYLVIHFGYYEFGSIWDLLVLLERSNSAMMKESMTRSLQNSLQTFDL